MPRIARIIARITTLGLLSTLPAQAQLTPINYDQAATAYQNLNFSQAEKIWRTLADEGNANAQYALAVMHLKGEASQPDNKTAFDLLKLAAQQNHLTAVFNLGVAYWEGTGTEIDKARALNWWEVAARGNDSGAQFNLGLAYYIGDGRPADRQKAKLWIEKAAQNGHPQAPQLLSAIQREEASPTASLANEAEPTTQMTGQADQTQPSPNVPAPAVARTDSVAPAMPSETEPSLNPDQPRAKPAEQTTPAVLESYWQSINQIVAVRARPNETAIELKTLKPNTPLKWLKTKGKWMQVELPGNYAVWVHGDFINQNGENGVVKGTNVNVRPLPEIQNPDAAPVGRLNTGDKAKILLHRGDWVKILPEKALPAWILSKEALKYRVSKNKRAQEWVTFSKTSSSN